MERRRPSNTHTFRILSRKKKKKRERENQTEEDPEKDRFKLSKITKTSCRRFLKFQKPHLGYKMSRTSALTAEMQKHTGKKKAYHFQRRHHNRNNGSRDNETLSKG